MARLVDGKYVPEDDQDFRDWDADKIVHEVRERSKELEKERQSFWRRYAEAIEFGLIK